MTQVILCDLAIKCMTQKIFLISLYNNPFVIISGTFKYDVIQTNIIYYMLYTLINLC